MEIEVNEATGMYIFPTKTLSKKQILELAEKIAESELKNPKLTSVTDAKRYIRAALMYSTREQFGVVFLDNKHRVITTEILFYGTIDSAAVHPRDIVVKALEVGANAIMVFHNHPSGETEPSQADIATTAKIKDALSLMDIRLLDHFIVGKGDTYSLAQNHLI